MSDPDPQDEQGVAEAVDEDVLGADEVADIGEDVVRATFPPDHQQGIDIPSPVEEPDELPPVDEPVTGLLETDDDPDEEVAELGDPELLPSAEEAAVHETGPPPLHGDDAYPDD
jgi:hypothetical protein